MSDKDTNPSTTDSGSVIRVCSDGSGFPRVLGRLEGRSEIVPVEAPPSTSALARLEVLSELTSAYNVIYAEFVRGRVAPQGAIIRLFEGIKAVRDLGTPPPTLAEAMKVLSEAIEMDEDYRHGWQANLAMCFHDALSSAVTPAHPEYDAREICNEGATRFLDILTKE